MADLQKLVTDLSQLTVLEAADLAKMLEEKWGVSAAAAVAVAAAPSRAQDGPVVDVHCPGCQQLTLAISDAGRS